MFSQKNCVHFINDVLCQNLYLNHLLTSYIYFFLCSLCYYADNKKYTKRYEYQVYIFIYNNNNNDTKCLAMMTGKQTNLDMAQCQTKQISNITCNCSGVLSTSIFSSFLGGGVGVFLGGGEGSGSSSSSSSIGIPPLSIPNRTLKVVRTLLSFNFVLKKNRKERNILKSLIRSKNNEYTYKRPLSLCTLNDIL